MSESDLSDWEWNCLQPLMPQPSTGRPAHDHRRILNGIFWILHTGTPWCELPWRYGPWPTVANRFYRWRQAGIGALARLGEVVFAIANTPFCDGERIDASPAPR